MRKKGSKDKNKRKVKTILDGIQERNLIKDYEQGLRISELRKKYNVTKAYISSMFKSRNIKKRIYLSIIKQWETIDSIGNLKENISGVYGIYFINKTDHNDISLYIGSSVNVKSRLGEHYRNLKNDNHRSKLLSKYFFDENYSMVFSIIERCSEEFILQRETYHLHEYNKSCLINMWKSTREEDLRPWLEKAVTYSSYKKHYTINNDTGCKESNNVHKGGYARIEVVIGESKDKGQKKYFYKHRVAYWEKYGEYPELIRHKCNNPKCYNADHLEKGNHKDNILDRRGNFPKTFEEKWVELKGDLEKLTEYFSERWNASQKWRGKLVSNQIYLWERKLHLRKKYPQILDSHGDRRFSLSYQKLGRNRKKNRIANNKV